VLPIFRGVLKTGLNRHGFHEDGAEGFDLLSAVEVIAVEHPLPQHPVAVPF
jgi:hypothetical protein